jgi:hypothetical protein
MKEIEVRKQLKRFTRPMSHAIRPNSRPKEVYCG